MSSDDQVDIELDIKAQDSTLADKIKFKVNRSYLELFEQHCQANGLDVWDQLNGVIVNQMERMLKEIEYLQNNDPEGLKQYFAELKRRINERRR